MMMLNSMTRMEMLLRKVGREIRKEGREVEGKERGTELRSKD